MFFRQLETFSVVRGRPHEMRSKSLAMLLKPRYGPAQAVHQLDRGGAVLEGGRAPGRGLLDLLHGDQPRRGISRAHLWITR